MQHNQSLALSTVASHHEYALRQLHLQINQYYYNLIYGHANNASSSEICLANLIEQESAWFEEEKKACLEQYDCHAPVTNMTIADLALTKHAVFNHPLFDYLCFDASLEELKQFIYSESILNLEFFDYLVFAIIGASDEAKSEIITNLWDEAGRGDIKRYHTTLFSHFMQELGLVYDRNQVLTTMSSEGIAGINLFSCLAFHSQHKMKYYGLLAATEMLDPGHYTKLIKGIKRIFKNKRISPAYYTEHETIDVEHASGWMQKVVIPELEKYPEKTNDFWLGFYMRLHSALRYYDRLYSTFVIQQAA